MSEKPSLISGVHHISMKTDNWEESLHFYCDVLGFTPGGKTSGSSGRMQLLQAGGNVAIELTEIAEQRKSQEEPETPRYAHVALRVIDTAALMDKVRAAGYEITLETKTIHSGDFHAVIGFFKGPQGELIEAFQEIPAEEAA
jgi:glyoxylase I family protein